MYKKSITGCIGRYSNEYIRKSRRSLSVLGGLEVCSVESGQEAFFPGLVFTFHPGRMRHSDQHVGDHAGDQLVDPRLDTGTGDHNPSPLHASPVGCVALE